MTKIGFFAGEARRVREHELCCSKMERGAELMIAVDVTAPQLRWTRRSKEPN